MSLKDALLSGKFAITGEVAPKRGSDLTHLMESASHLAPHVDAINVTDNQRASVRISSLVVSKALLDAGHEPVYQLTCRDRNRIALQSDLMGAWALGIGNVLVVSGDHPGKGDNPSAKPVYDLDSVQLLGAISGLNSGRDIAGNELHGATGFFAGAAANPAAQDLDAEVARVRMKISQGARFFQTQAVYDAEVFGSFMDRVGDLDAYFLAGIVPLKSARMANFMNDNIPGIDVPKKMIAELEASDDQERTGMEQAARIIKKLASHCDGVHLMTLGAEKNVGRILELAGLKDERL